MGAHGATLNGDYGRLILTHVILTNQMNKQYATDPQFSGFLAKYRNAVPSVRYNLYRWFTSKYVLTDKQKKAL